MEAIESASPGALGYTQVTFLRIYKATNEDQRTALLLANGRQQLPLTIRFRAANDENKWVRLLDEDIRRKIRLCFRDGTSLLPATDTPQDSYPWSTTFNRNTNYEWNEGVIQEITALYLDATRALENRGTLVVSSDGRAYESPSLEGHLWDKAWFDAYLDDLLASGVLPTVPKDLSILESSSRLGRYDEYAYRPAPPAALPDGIDESELQEVTVYLTGRVAENPNICAAILEADGDAILSATNSDVEDSSGSGFQGLFNSQVTVNATLFHTLGISAYGEKMPNEAHRLLHHFHKSGPDGQSTWETIVNVTFNQKPWRLLRAWSPLGHEYFSAFRDAGEHDDVEWSITYFAQPGQTWVRFNDSWVGYFRDGNTGKEVKSVYRGIMQEFGVYADNVANSLVMIAQYMGKSHWQFNDTLHKPIDSIAFKSSNIVIYDCYGNEHLLRIDIDRLHKLDLYTR